MIRQRVKDFFLREDVVWASPGMKDEMFVRDDSGKKVKVRKFYLTHFIKEVYDLFKEANPDVSIGCSKFCSLRPENVLLLKDTKFDQCKTRKNFLPLERFRNNIHK